jgi:small subunit ribosomal protein S11
MDLNSKYNNYFKTKIEKVLSKRNQVDEHSINDLVLHLKCSFNNTIACITNIKGNVLMWSSPACHGLKGSKRSTVFAARVAITEIAKNLQSRNVKSVDIRLKGLGPGRRKITKILNDYNIEIRSIQDVTPLPFNGTRLRRKRRI